MRVPVGGQFQLTNDALKLTDQITAFRYHPDVECIRDGEFVAVWASGADEMDVTLTVFSPPR